MSDQNIFAALRGGGRIWAVAAVHGEADRLAALHRHLLPEVAAGDQLVYLGNYFGLGPAVRATIEEMLVFRRLLMAHCGLAAEDVVFLRGAQEETWQKLLQLQFAPNPLQVLQWMLDQGVGPTIGAYGGEPRDAVNAAREGILALTRWTSAMRQKVRALDGHTALMAVLRHAAYSEDGSLLFVHAGVDPGRPLSAQSDSFWWGGAGFGEMAEPYDGFALVVRGYDWRHGGMQVGDFTATIDGGCGFGGPLVAACFEGPGITAVIEA